MTNDGRAADVAITLVPYDPSWPAQFGAVGAMLREAVGDWATRIDHVGSTAVVGLVAKPVIDVQMSTADPAQLDDPSHPVRRGLHEVGFDIESDNEDRRKRFLRRRDGSVQANLHVRRDGCVSQQQALLFRDFLRVDASARQLYAAEKQRLAQARWPSVDAYAEAKSAVVWSILQRADRWSWWGWQPSESDA